MTQIAEGSEAVFNSNHRYARARRLVKAKGGIEPEVYDMCRNSCVAFIDNLSENRRCPECRTERYDKKRDGTEFSAKTFTYFPLIPRLRAQLQNKDRRELLKYGWQYINNALPVNSHYRRPSVGQINDIFDGYHFQSQYQTGAFPQDVFVMYLGMSCDGFTIFRKYSFCTLLSELCSLFARKKDDCWLLQIINYSLPPDVRSKSGDCMTLGIIPGPKHPKCLSTFFFPLIKELERTKVFL